MFDAIKRLLGFRAAEAPPPRRNSRRRRNQPEALSGPTPLPEVVEGNDETDWDLWQDSVDSQMQSLNSRSAPLNSRSGPLSTQPATLGSDELDPFARVGKNRDS